jgi:predicted nucleic acid-binding protein
MSHFNPRTMRFVPHHILRYFFFWECIGPLDTLIAAHNLSLDAVLVTHNTREFARVPRCRLKTDYHRNKQQ